MWLCLIDPGWGIFLGDEGSRVERKGGVGVESSTVVCFWRWLIVSLVSSSHFPHDANIWSKQRNAQMEPDKDKENCMLSQVRNACGEMLMFFSLIDHLFLWCVIKKSKCRLCDDWTHLTQIYLASTKFPWIKVLPNRFKIYQKREKLSQTFVNALWLILPWKHVIIEVIKIGFFFSFES